MVLFAILVSGSYPIGAYIANDIDPIALTFIRFLLASVLLAIFLWHKNFPVAGKKYRIQNGF